jgi:hypothetical protein
MTGTEDGRHGLQSGQRDCNFPNYAVAASRHGLGGIGKANFKSKLG